MLKLLTFTTLFPNAVAPHHGIFTEITLRQQLQTGQVQAAVVAPVPWFPSRAGLFGRYAGYAGVPSEDQRAGVRVLHPRYPNLPRIGMHMAPLMMARAARASVERLIADGHDFDLIDAHYFYPDGVAAVLLGRALGKPVVIKALGSDINLLTRYRWPRRQIQWAARHSAAMTSVCQALRTEMIRVGLPAGRIHVMRNGVDLDLFHPEPRAAARASIGAEGFTLISVGHLVANKGHDKAIAALPRLPDARLLVVGGGPERGRLEALAQRLGVAARVRFAGVLTQDQLRTCYSGADALVLPSSREGWPNVLLEAMACGTPALASRVGGTAEVITCHAAGLLLSENSAAGIAAAVTALRAAPPERAATRAHAALHSWHATTRAQLDLFARIASRQPLPAPLTAQSCTTETNCLT